MQRAPLFHDRTLMLKRQQNWCKLSFITIACITQCYFLAVFLLLFFYHDIYCLYQFECNQSKTNALNTPAHSYCSVMQFDSD